MIEIGLGLIAILAAAAISSGLTTGLVPFPLGNGAAIATSVFGLALVLRGLYRLARNRQTGDRRDLRSLGLAGSISALVIVVALAMPSLSQALNLVTIGGFPLGVYLMGQGVLILFVVVLFVFASWQNRIDRAGEP